MDMNAGNDPGGSGLVRRDGAGEANPGGAAQGQGDRAAARPQARGLVHPRRPYGNLVFLAGQGPLRGGKPTVTGKVGAQLTEQQGYQAARATILNSLAALRAEIGSLDRVRRVVKLVGWVNSAPGFTRQPWVINGASDLLVEVFGEAGRHARSALGANELPLDIPVEVEIVVEVAP